MMVGASHELVAAIVTEIDRHCSGATAVIVTAHPADGVIFMAVMTSSRHLRATEGIADRCTFHDTASSLPGTPTAASWQSVWTAIVSPSQGCSETVEDRF